MSAPAIDARGIAKRYVKYEDTPMLVSALRQLHRRTRRESLWAVQELDLVVQPGECVGVLGRNGSGKSTLLQMIAGITAPTRGELTVRGRVAPLISVGVGFHPELTGRDNVYINGSILGMRRAEIDARFDDIVEFSGIAEFIDTPVKFYSSGMSVRLGFSVAVAAEPDVLLVDEVLAVGDMAFQVKCYQRINEIRASGTTILVVTHNLPVVRGLCPRTVVLDRGAMVHDGDTVEGVTLLHRLLAETDSPDESATGLPYVRGLADVEAVEVVDATGRVTDEVRAGEPVRIRCRLRAAGTIHQPYVGIAVSSASGVTVCADSNVFLPFDDVPAGTTRTFDATFDAALVEGRYDVALTVGAHVDDRAVALAVIAPQPLHVHGRGTVHGVADLHAVFGDGLRAYDSGRKEVPSAGSPPAGPAVGSNG